VMETVWSGSAMLSWSRVAVFIRRSFKWQQAVIYRCPYGFASHMPTSPLDEYAGFIE